MEFNNMNTNGHKQEANISAAESTPTTDDTITVKQPVAGFRLEK